MRSGIGRWGVAISLAAIAALLWLHVRPELWWAGQQWMAQNPPAASGPASMPQVADGAGVAPVARPAQWAKPLARPGLPNLHQVSATLYRGAQPTAEGFASLQAMGVRTVVNLRAFHTNRKLMAGTSLEYRHIYFQSWHACTKEVAEFLRLAGDSAAGPIFVHCKHGADRTGMMVAMYRIVIQGWSKQEAIAELAHGGFGHHPELSFIIGYIQEADIDDLRQRAGIK